MAAVPGLTSRSFALARHSVASGYGLLVFQFGTYCVPGSLLGVGNQAGEVQTHSLLAFMGRQSGRGAS